MSQIEERLARVQDAIERAQRARGPGPQVRLIAVSKYHSVDSIIAAYDAGQRDFGENYVQEFEHKAQALATRCPEIRWHMIGALQRNKVSKIIGRATIHTVDRSSLVSELQKRALAQSITQAVLVQVNPGEVQKAGVSSAELSDLLQAVEEASNLHFRGLMMIPPQGDAQATHSHFEWFANLAKSLELAKRFGRCELSMGMSSDFELAIKQGAHYVRVGSAIFGARPPRPDNSSPAV